MIVPSPKFVSIDSLTGIITLNPALNSQVGNYTATITTSFLDHPGFLLTQEITL